MKEEIDLENFCPWDWMQKEATLMLDEEIKRAKETFKNET